MEKRHKSTVEDLLGDDLMDEDGLQINELEHYDRLKCPKVFEDPLLWRKDHANVFPKLKPIAGLYLGTSATSASCERFTLLVRISVPTANNGIS